MILLTFGFFSTMASFPRKMNFLVVYMSYAENSSEKVGRSIKPQNFVFSDLARVFKLCSRVKNTLERLQEMFQEHVNAKGIEAMDRVLESSDRNRVSYNFLNPI